MSTGFPPGRPRKGELRPNSKSAARAREAYALRAADPSYRRSRAERQAEWRAKNPDRNAEIARKAYLRRKMWAGLDEAEMHLHSVFNKLAK